MAAKRSSDVIIGPTKRMLKRMLVIMLAIVILTTSVSGVRLAQIMLVQGEKYQTMASEQQLYDTTLSAPRGDIYDSNMKLLATSSTAWNVFLTPNALTKIKDETEKTTVKNIIADGLSSILEVEREKILEYTEKTGSYYIVIKKRVDQKTADAVREFISDNKKLSLSKYIGIDETTKRYYPNGSLASVVLGFVGSDNQGLAGLESYYDTSLTGVSGRVVAAKNAKGADMPFTYQKVVDAKAGNSLVTTIDTYVQYVTEKYLDKAVKDNAAAERGAAIVMNVNTGEVLGMAIKGDFDPNDPFTLSEEDRAIVDKITDDDESKSKKVAELRNRQWRNKAVSDTYEPGSVFKIVTLAAALEENVTNRNMTFTCPGYITVSGQRYSCSHKNGHGTQNLLEATANSCNPAFITLGTLLGAHKFSKYFDAFGLTSRTGIDLPGESTPVYHLEKNMGPTELASSAFGQTFNTTPIQMITAISAAVNGGYLVKPHMVKQVLDSEGKVVENIGTTVKRQVISKETSKLVCEMMAAVVDGGTAKNAKIAGYSLGGKTGTSQKMAQIIETGNSRLYIASFLGVAPIDDPEIAILVMIDEPTGDSYYGGTVAAPVAAQIFEDILPYLGYEPHYTDEELKNLSVSVPDCVDKTIASAKNAIAAAGLTAKVIGEGEKVISQSPKSSDSINSGGVVVIYTEDTEEYTVTVPNFNSMTAREVTNAAAAAGVNIDFSGTDVSSSAVRAYKQSIASGTKVKQGTIVTVNFRDPSAYD